MDAVQNALRQSKPAFAEAATRRQVTTIQFLQIFDF
jgi:hypothetical protein